MPYPTEVKGMAPINYRSGPAATSTSDVNGAFAATNRPERHPATPILKAYVGDPVEVHALVTPGSEQMHVFSLGGESLPLDPFLPGSNQVQARGIGPWETLQANIRGGAGGGATVGDLFYGDLRRPFTEAGLWGIQRVLADASCPIRPLDARGCTGTSGRIHHPRRSAARDTHHSHDSRLSSPTVAAATQAGSATGEASSAAAGEGRTRNPGRRGSGHVQALVPARRTRASLQAGAGSTYGHCRHPREGRGRRPRRLRDDDRRGPLGAEAHLTRARAEVPSLRSLGLAWGALAAVVAIGADGGDSPPRSRVPAPAPLTAPQFDPEGSQAIAKLGRALPLRTADGRVVEVAALDVRPRRGSERLIDVRLRYELRGGATYRMDPAREAQLVDGSGQLLTDHAHRERPASRVGAGPVAARTPPRGLGDVRSPHGRAGRARAADAGCGHGPAHGPVARQPAVVGGLVGLSRPGRVRPRSESPRAREHALNRRGPRPPDERQVLGAHETKRFLKVPTRMVACVGLREGDPAAHSSLFWGGLQCTEVVSYAAAPRGRIGRS